MSKANVMIIKILKNDIFYERSEYLISSGMSEKWNFSEKVNFREKSEKVKKC